MKRTAAKFVPRVPNNDKKQNRLSEFKACEITPKRTKISFLRSKTEVKDGFIVMAQIRRYRGNIHAESQAIMDRIMKREFQSLFQQWERRWSRCINSKGEYFERESTTL